MTIADAVPNTAVSNTAAPTVLTADIPPVSQEQINRFGALLGTHGRIHTDPDFARTTPLKGVIVQGMLVLAPVHEAMTRIFGAERWLTAGRIETKIVAYTRPGEAGRLTVTIDRSDDDEAAGSFAITRPNGDSVLVGTFRLGAAA
ncbi:MaoC family dehydratase [Azospirillum doebereinerae]